MRRLIVLIFILIIIFFLWIWYEISILGEGYLEGWRSDSVFIEEPL